MRRAHVKAWVDTARQNKIVLQAFICIHHQLWGFFLLPVLDYFHSQFFSHSINTLILFSVLSLSLSLPPSSLAPYENGEQLWRGTHASLMLNRSLIYQMGPSCSAMTGLNYWTWVCSKTTSPSPPPFLYSGVLCVCMSDGEIRCRKHYTCLSCVVLP